MNSMELERALGRVILDHLRAQGSDVRVRSEFAASDLLGGSDSRQERWSTRTVSRARAGLPAVTGGRLVVLLSGGFDSGVAAYKMMRRGAHVSFVHFFATPSASRGSSRPVAEEIVRTLTPYQFTSRLYLIPFDAGPAPDRGRSARKFPRAALPAHDGAHRARDRAGRARAGPGDRRQRLAGGLADAAQPGGASTAAWICRFTARWPETTRRRSCAWRAQIGTYHISCEPFEDCCPRFMPRSPAIFRTAPSNWTAPNPGSTSRRW